MLQHNVIYLDGTMSVKAITDACEKDGISPDRTIYIFPGNPSHHLESVSLRSIKTGSGLADIAAQLGKQKLPTLSLPTRLEVSQEMITEFANIATYDLFKALGAEYNFIIPVCNKDKKNNDRVIYFTKSLTDTDSLVPNFFGSVVTTSPRYNDTTLLGDYYVTAISELKSLAYLIREFGKSSERVTTKLTELEQTHPDWAQAYSVGCQLEGAADFVVKTVKTPVAIARPDRDTRSRCCWGIFSCFTRDDRSSDHNDERKSLLNPSKR